MFNSDKTVYSFTAQVYIFKVETPWLFVQVPKKDIDQMKEYCFNGRVPIDAFLGETRWETSFLPIGKGKQIVPIPKRVRLREAVAEGQRVKIRYSLRKKKTNIQRLMARRVPTI